MVRMRRLLLVLLAGLFIVNGGSDFLLAADNAADSDGQRIAFLAGKRSHGYGAHEHYAGCLLLARALEQAMPGYKTDVFANGGPEDWSKLADYDAVVMYADGGGGHPVLKQVAAMDKLAAQGVGIGAIHYAVEVPLGEPGEKMLSWIGGYFEPHWSVNPHWTAQFKKFPKHPITRGVKPFAINDEWYYHMRFPKKQEGLTRLLVDLPPDETLSRRDGAHSGNPHVRKAIANDEPQAMMWAYERPEGGRGFGFTGGHVHWNWGNESFRKIVLNAIVWIAEDEVPENGVGDKEISKDDLLANQDYEKPKGFEIPKVGE